MRVVVMVRMERGRPPKTSVGRVSTKIETWPGLQRSTCRLRYRQNALAPQKRGIGMLCICGQMRTGLYRMNMTGQVEC